MNGMHVGMYVMYARTRLCFNVCVCVICVCIACMYLCIICILCIYVMHVCMYVAMDARTCAL